MFILQFRTSLSVISGAVELSGQQQHNDGPEWNKVFGNVFAGWSLPLPWIHPFEDWKAFCQ